MAKSITIHVTQADVDKGQDTLWERAFECPIAQALNRQYRGKWIVGLKKVYTQNQNLSYLHSIRSKRFLNSADHYRPLKPTTFILKEG